MVAKVVVVHDDVCFMSADALAAAAAAVAVAVVTVPVLLVLAVVVALNTASVACFFQVCNRGNKIEDAAVDAVGA